MNMQEMELTWGQVIRIWWAAFWRWIIWANLTVDLYAGLVGISLLIFGHSEWGQSHWAYDGIILASIPGAIIALRLALKVPYKGFRIVIVAANSTR